MRTDMAEELAASGLTYVRALCYESNHPEILVLTELKTLIEIELNRMAGLDPDRNK